MPRLRCMGQRMGQQQVQLTRKGKLLSAEARQHLVATTKQNSSDPQGGSNTQSVDSPEGAGTSYEKGTGTSSETASITSSNNKTQHRWQWQEIRSAASSGDAEKLKRLLTMAKDMVDNGTKSCEDFHRERDQSLTVAIISKNREILSILLDHGAQLVDKPYPTVLTAVGTGCEEVIDELIKRGCDFSVIGPGNCSALHCATVNGNVEILKKMLALNQIDIDLQSTTGTALHKAAMYSRNECARVLIDHGADVKCVAPLLMAAFRGNYALVRCLVKHGADVSMRDYSGKMAWYYAAQNDQIRTVDFLEGLMDKKEFFTLSQDGKSLLHDACTDGDVNVAERLIVLGLSVTAIDNKGITPLMSAVCGYKCSLDLLKALSKSPSFPEIINVQDDHGRTALELLFSGYGFKQSTAEFLMKAGADVHLLPDDADTLLMRFITDIGRRDCLMRFGASLNQVLPNGKNALFSVVISSTNCSTVRWALENNIDIRMSQHRIIFENQVESPFTKALTDSRFNVALALYLSGCKLKGIEEWSCRDHSKTVLGTNKNIEKLVHNILDNDYANRPASLWQQARHAVLAALGCGPIRDKVRHLGLPSEISSLMDPYQYIIHRKMRENLFPNLAVAQKTVSGDIFLGTSS